MKLTMLLAAALSATTLLAGNPPAPEKSASEFEKLKGLVGTWQGKDNEGKPVSVSYKLISGESALMETLRSDKHHGEMVTIYHLDGEQLMLTHYCTMNNQPRMRADLSSTDPSTIHFSFMDATNLASPDDPHMHGLIVTVKDKDHFTQEWTMRANGKDGPAKVFSFERKK